MLRTLARLLLFYIRHKAEIDSFVQKHAEPVRALLADVAPIIEAYTKEEAPGSAGVDKAVKLARRVADNASPMAGDEFSPVNPNPNAG